jgi:hypothetical protein
MRRVTPLGRCPRARARWSFLRRETAATLKKGSGAGVGRASVRQVSRRSRKAPTVIEADRMKRRTRDELSRGYEDGDLIGDTARQASGRLDRRNDQEPFSRGSSVTRSAV